MKVIYHCFGSSHSSVVAANIHVGNLPMDRIPTRQEIIALPHFDKTESKQIGIPFFIGKDEWNNDVYIIGMTHKKNIVRTAIISLLNIFNIAQTEIILINALEHINIMTKIGGFLSRGIGFTFIGRPIVLYGIQACYSNLINLVDKTKKDLIYNMNLDENQ
jgi:hypothetical protein